MMGSEKMNNALILSCSMCANYCPNKRMCKKTKEPRRPENTEFAKTCIADGYFVRYLHVIPDYYNYFPNEKSTSEGWRKDYSKVPTDNNGNHLIVVTRRGEERAIPANETVMLRVNAPLDRVDPWITYQGQREMIFDLGITVAESEARKRGVKLTILPEEQNSLGDLHQLNQHVQKLNYTGNRSWMKDETSNNWGW